MLTDAELLDRIKAAVDAENYRLGTHGILHMFKEGLTEKNLVEAVHVKSRIVERYPDESRCLVSGYFQMSENVRSPLHLVFEYLREDAVDIVTAYVPQKPWWVTPWQRGKTT